MNNGNSEKRGWQPTLGNGAALLMVVPLLALLAGFVLYPLIKLTIDSLTTGDGWGNYQQVFESASITRALIVTILVSVLVAVVSVVTGAMLAWYMKMVKSPVGRILVWVAVLAPIWMGTVVKNYAIILLVSKEGALNDFLGLFGIEPVSILYTTGAVVVGMVYTMLPYAVFSLFAVVRGIDESLLSAAQSMGASRVTAIRTVLIPLIMPGVVASLALVFAISVGFYITPVLLGGGQAPFMATVIDDNIFTYFNYPLASAASVVLLLVALITVVVALKLVGRDRLVRAAA